MDNYNQPSAMPPYGQPPVPPMSFGEAIQICIAKFATFSGRASRAEYWWWYLFCVLFNACFGIVSAIFGDSILGHIILWIGYVASLAMLIPTLAVSWRRMHDIGKGGGWFFINCIPLVGTILWIIWCIKPGEPVPNRFGNPV